MKGIVLADARGHVRIVAQEAVKDHAKNSVQVIAVELVLNLAVVLAKMIAEANPNVMSN